MDGLLFGCVCVWSGVRSRSRGSWKWECYGTVLALDGAQDESFVGGGEAQITGFGKAQCYDLPCLEMLERCGHS